MKRLFFQIFFLLTSVSTFAHELRMESQSQPEKIYVQPEQVTFWEKQIWICLGPENWIPVKGISSDPTGFYALSFEADPGDLVPGTKKCWNCGTTNALKAPTCRKCGEKI